MLYKGKGNTEIKLTSIISSILLIISESYCLFRLHLFITRYISTDNQIPETRSGKILASGDIHLLYSLYLYIVSGKCR